MALSNLTKVQTIGIGSNIEVVGVVTTGQFKSGTSNLHSSGVELTNLNVSGIATIAGNLSIGGTLTYQDVTNIDSVGLITARAGINVSGGQLDVGSNIKLGNAGVITATTFVGNLTGTASQVTIANGADNRVLTAASANTLNGESTLTYNGGAFLQTKTGSNPTLTLSRNESVGDEAAIGTINFANNTGNTTNARVAAYSDGTGNVGGHLYFETRDPSNSTLSERVRIKSNGYVGIGTNNPQRPFVISNDGAAGAEFNIPDNHGGLSLNLYNRTTTGWHPLSFNSADVRFGINAVEKARLASTGQFLVGTTTPSGYSNRFLTVAAADGDAHIEIRTANDHAGTISFSDTSNATSAAYSGFIQYVHSGNHMVFGLSSAEKVRIDNNGNLCVGITGGSAKFHTKGEQGGGFIKCDAAEGTTRFFLTGNDTSACELNMYNDAGTQATIIKAGASNNSTDIYTTQAGGRFRVYVTPLSGRTYRSAVFRPFQIDEYGELRQERGSEGWTSGFYETNNGGQKYHHRHAYTGASSQNVNLIRVRRHYWGAGNYKFIVKQTYYGGSYESWFWLNGHAANGNTSSFNISHNNINSGNSNWIQKTATSHSSPGNNYSGWTDVFISIPTYTYFDIRIETSMMNNHSYDINNLGNDAYALHPFS